MTLIDVGHQTCLFCGMQVEVTSVMSTGNTDDCDLDTRPRGMARLAEKHYVHYCPNCGYASYNLEKDITNGNHNFINTEEYREVVANKEILDDSKKFYLVGLIQEQCEEYQRAASSFLRASWFFNDNLCTEWVIRSKKKGIAMMEKSDFTYKNEQASAILIDTYRRIGNFENALRVINQFGIDNVKDSLMKKIFLFEKDLCMNEDKANYTTRDVEQNIL